MNSFDLILLILSILMLYFFHVLGSSTIKPIHLSNPILDNLVIASTSLSLLHTTMIFVSMLFNNSPTHGAKRPSRPIKIEPLICDLI